MSTLRPDWLLDSPYFDHDADEWALKENAPEELKKKFREYMEQTKNC